jgi:hypothetical protein
MATLKASTNRSLRDAYHKVLDDLDDNKGLYFALIQDACARQFRRRPDDDRRDYLMMIATPYAFFQRKRGLYFLGL